MTGDNMVGTPSALTCGDAAVGLDERPTLYSVDATPEERQLRTASARRKRLDAQLAVARSDERVAILAALGSGMRQVQVCSITGFTREYIRRIRAERDGGPSPDTHATG